MIYKKDLLKRIKILEENVSITERNRNRFDTAIQLLAEKLGYEVVEESFIDKKLPSFFEIWNGIFSSKEIISKRIVLKRVEKKLKVKKNKK